MPDSATSPTAATSSLMPSAFSADTGTTLHPSSLESLSTSISSPSLRIWSIMFSAMTVGMPVSRIWRVRKRFLSRFVASTMLMTASGLSFTRKFLETISSGEYGDREYIPGRSTSS